MAELDGEFLVERLNSRQLLALLFVCECRRKKTLETLCFFNNATPDVWSEFTDRFAARLSKLPESERVYLIGSHLQSTEEIDLYSNVMIEELLAVNRELLEILARNLNADPRFV